MPSVAVFSVAGRQQLLALKEGSGCTALGTDEACASGATVRGNPLQEEGRA